MKYFNLSEFDSPDQKGSGENMNKEFLTLLDSIRELAGTPMKVNSGYRTKEHNRSIGGRTNSAHTRGYAADISAKDSITRMKIVSAAIALKMPRIGIYKTFIHLDNDPTLPQGVMWVGH